MSKALVGPIASEYFGYENGEAFRVARVPIVDEAEIGRLLGLGRISAVTVDTNIFDKKRLQLSSPTLQAFTGFKEKPFAFILAGTVAREVCAHIEEIIDSALRSAKREIGQALNAFETKEPTRDQLLDQISRGRTASEAAQQRFGKYVEDTGCEILDDASLASISSIYEDYFKGSPPFGKGRKKTEFPDALALNALERAAKDRQIGVLVVSKDGGWQDFCAASERLYLVPNIERALALINNAPLGLQKSIENWLAETWGRAAVVQGLQYAVRQLEFSVSGVASSGEMDAYAMGGELEDVNWTHDAEIDIISTGPSGEGALRVIVSLPLLLTIRVPVELSFSVWDGVDRESISMGGRVEEVDEDLEVRVTLTLDVHDQGTDNEAIELDDTQLDIQYHQINIGEVDMFETEDYVDAGE